MLRPPTVAFSGAPSAIWPLVDRPHGLAPSAMLLPPTVAFSGAPSAIWLIGMAWAVAALNGITCALAALARCAAPVVGRRFPEGRRGRRRQCRGRLCGLAAAAATAVAAPSAATESVAEAASAATGPGRLLLWCGHAPEARAALDPRQEMWQSGRSSCEALASLLRLRWCPAGARGGGGQDSPRWPRRRAVRRRR